MIIESGCFDSNEAQPKELTFENLRDFPDGLVVEGTLFLINYNGLRPALDDRPRGCIWHGGPLNSLSCDVSKPGPRIAVYKNGVKIEARPCVAVPSIPSF